MTASASAVSEVKRIAGQPRIVLVRHAESEFNRMEEEYISAFRPELRNMPEHWDTDEVFDPHVWDAPLSPTGRRQCAELRAALWDNNDSAGSNSTMWLLRECWLVMCSPYTRALQTAGLVFGHPESPGPRIHVMPELGEYVSSSCDIGRNGKELLRDPLLRPVLDAFPSLEAQLAALEDGWWGPERPEHLPPGLHIPQRYREPPRRLQERSAAALVTLAKELEMGAGAGGCVAIVGHSKSFHVATGRWLENCVPTEVELVAPDAPGKPLSLRVID